MAVDLITKALTVKPDYAEAHHNLGNVFISLERFDTAEASFCKSIVINPDFAEAHHNLGSLFMIRGQFDEAVKSFCKAVTINPNYVEAHDNLGNAYLELNKLDDAILSYENALSVNNDYADAHSDLGNALRISGRQDEAVVHCQKAININPQHAKAQNNLGVALLELGQHNDAAIHFHEAIRIDPLLHLPFYNLHATHYSNENLEPAALCLEEAAQRAPEDRRVQFLLGMIRDYQGKTKQAKKHFGNLGSNLEIDDKYAAYLDSWHYIKSSSSNLPRLFGDTSEGLKIGISAALTTGLVLEFGVRFGTTVRQLSGLVNQDVHGFDSFQGLPEPWHDNPKGIYTTNGLVPKVPENVYLHVGLFDKSLPLFLDDHTDSIRFMNVDCDMYGSTKVIFDLLGDRIVSGTVIAFDEYFANKNWRNDEFKAFQEAVEKYGWRYDYLAVSLFSKQAIVLIH